MSSQVFVSSWGAIYGSQTDAELIQAAFHDQDITKNTYINIGNIDEIISKNEQELMGPHAVRACLAVEKALAKAKLWSHRNVLRGKGTRFRHPRAAIIAGSSLGMIQASIDAQLDKDKKLHPYTLAKIRGNSIAAPLAIRYGLGGGDFSLSAASATGGQAIWLAANLIQANIADIVIVVCADVSKTSGFTERAMHAMGAVSQTGSSRPLSAARDGMIPVEASAAIILESEAHAQQRNFTPLARWVNGSVKNDCHHLIAPQPQGLGLQEAVEEVLIKMHPETKIDWLSLHATGTKAWDAIEAQVISKIFNDNIPHISAFKRSFGHTLSSACLLSIAMLVEGLAKQNLPLLPNDIDPSFQLNSFKSKPDTVKFAMNWSVGMGGSVAVNLFEALDA